MDRHIRTVHERNPTYSGRELYLEASGTWDGPGRITQQMVEELMRGHEPSQVQAPLPRFGGKISTGTYGGEKNDIDLIDFNCKLQHSIFAKMDLFAMDLFETTTAKRSITTRSIIINCLRS